MTPDTLTQGAALAPLSPAQRQKLAAMARFAHDQSDADVDFDTWRRAEVKRIVGRSGLRECRNEHYLPLKAHFLDGAGHSGAALRASVKHQTEPRSWAKHALIREATAAKDVLPQAMAYARGFLRNARGVSLEDADEGAIRQAVFVVRRKAQALRRLAKGGATAADVLKQILKRRPGQPRDPEKEPF